jgi:hypothetical protein
MATIYFSRFSGMTIYIYMYICICMYIYIYIFFFPGQNSDTGNIHERYWTVDTIVHYICTAFNPH